MQIHEITARAKLDEGILDKLGGAVSDKMDAISRATQGRILQQQTDQYVTNLLRKWRKVSATPGFTAPFTQPAVDNTEPATTAPAGISQRQAKLRSLRKGGQMSSALAGSKTGQTMQKMFGAPRGGIEDMPSDLEEAEDPGEDAYRQAFLNWARNELQTKETRTYQPITLDDVYTRVPGARTKLDQALTNIVANRNNANQQESAVREFLTTAVQGTQSIAADIRARNPHIAGGGKTKSKPGQMDTSTAQVAKAMDISQANLDRIKSVLTSINDLPKQKTGSNTLDNMFAAGGMLKPD